MSTHLDKMALRSSDIPRREFIISLLDSSIVTSVPFLLLLFNSYWLYARYFNIDEWMYVGYGYQYFDPTFYVTNYKISRLPWVLLEALVRGAFPPLASSWILAFGVLALGNVALYFALRIPFGRLPALFAGIFIAGLTFMHANGGPDYHNTLAGAFYCLAMLFCARCARYALNSRDLVFLGASFALSVHTNPLFINLAPVLIGQYLLSYRQTHSAFPPIFPAAVLSAGGAIGATILLGLTNRAFGRQFLFFMQQFKLVSSFIADSSNQKTWWLPWSSLWFVDIPYMGVFFAGALLALTTLFIALPSRNISQRYAFASIFSAGYVAALSIWMLWQSIGQTALEPTYFAYPLGFPLAGAFAAAVATAIVKEVQPLPLTIAGLVFAAAIITGAHFSDHIQALAGAFSWHSGIRVAAAFSFAFACLMLLRCSLWLAPIAIFSLCIANGLAVFDKGAYAAANCAMNKDGYEIILDASRILRKARIPGTQIFVFSDHGENVQPGPACSDRQVSLGWFQAAITATGFEDIEHYWDNKTLETVDPERWGQVATTGRIAAFLTYNPARISVLRDKLVAAGAKPGEARLFILHEGGITLPLYLVPFSR